MEFIAAGFEIIEQKPGLEGLFELIEIPGRICYGSLDKITEGSAKPFVERLMRSDHGAPLEHGTVYLKAPHEYDYYSNIDIEDNGSKLDKYMHNPYSKYVDGGEYVYVTTNLRVLFENGWLDDLDNYWCEPTEFHEKRVSVRFTIDRFTGEEFLRHRKASFNRESTRYVAFVKEKFGGGSIKFILPPWLKESDNSELLSDEQKEKVWYMNNQFEEMCGQIFNLYTNDELDEQFKAFDYWIFALKATEWSYNKLMTKCNWQAQQARTVLPCAINSPLIMSAFISDWRHFFNLRALGTTGAPHPQASELAVPLMNEFMERKLI
jgi:thymidylate synthase (FAD)